MPLAPEKHGLKSKEIVQAIDPDRAKAYAAATNDANEAYTSGKYAPPVFGVVPVWDALGEVVAEVIPGDFLLMVVHGEQDMHFHKPLVPGTTLKTVADAYSSRVGSSGTRFTTRITSVDASDGAKVMEQYATMFIRSLSDGEDWGEEKPDHTFPEDCRSNSVGELSIHVDDDQTYRYAEASGDHMPIHLDETTAKAVGLPGIIAHGLCTMAMTSQAILSLTAGGDPAKLRRLAVRFSKNVFPGNDVVTQVYSAGERDGRKLFAYEAVSNGDVVVKNGWAEVDG